MTAASLRAAAAIPLVVARHAEESALLCNQRFFLAGSAHAKLHHLRRLDDRLAAHLDGLAVARDAGSRACDEALARAGRGEVFAAIVLALENRDLARLERLLAIAELLPEVRDAVALAGGWASGESLRGIAKDMLVSPHAFRRAVAIAACDFHMVDPGDALHAAVADTDTVLRAQALRAVGECGRADLAAACVGALQDGDPGCRFWAARSAVLLGERHKPVRALHDATLLPEAPHGTQALSLLFKLATPAQAAPLLAEMLDKPGHVRDAVRSAGTVGDTRLVPWLIAQMEEPAMSRLAGEAFSTITGLDLAWLDLERRPPEDIESGPGDSPEDDNVAMDEDDGLPWPDPAKIGDWWAANAHGFQPGERYFMGAVPSWAHCTGVLRNGYQRQRMAAAEYLCLLRPGSKLFPTSAPAWRQQRWLAQWPDE
ncbi:TIGR02270 family protein [Variovorax boronicumulans]|uniref:TIGR02270 family protein n=1 Tax=Variovorax boronicumulans TaxID=436515 RepID=UPI00339B818F